MSDNVKIGSSRNSSKLKQEGRRRVGKKVVVAGLRTSDCDEEVFAVVVKFFGNGMCEVSCADGENRMCIIRKKFRGRLKRGNMVAVGSTVMVGLRLWEKNEKSALAKCDLLEVYNESELRKLRQRGAINLDKVTRASIVTEEDEIDFEMGDDDDGKKEKENGDDDDIYKQPERDFDLKFVSDDDDSDDENINIDDI